MLTESSSRISLDLDVRRAYARDASGLELVPDAVARPADVAEVAELMREAAATRTPVTPAGSAVVATAEIAVAIPIVLLLVRRKRTLDLEAFTDLKG